MGRFSFLNLLKEVVGMLNESRKLFLKNKKLMFSVLVFSLLLNGLVYLFNILTITLEITNLTQHLKLLPTMDPSSAEYIALLMEVFADFGLFGVSSDIFGVVYFIINLLSVLVIVHASALTYNDENVNCKDFVVLSLKSWKGPLFLGYWLFFVTILFPLLLLSTASLISFAVVTCVLLVLFALFASYLAIVWYLSLVVSVLEETYGIQALGEAVKIAKGMKPKLFLLNLFFGLLIFGLAQIETLGHHGQDVESLRDAEYTTLPTTSRIGALP
uniref:Transmembrane protein n=1 Tax=Brassica oleracea var. oleracea TaxID=109376 RepID=A0A0D3BY58_BRAOL